MAVVSTWYKYRGRRRHALGEKWKTGDSSEEEMKGMSERKGEK